MMPYKIEVNSVCASRFGVPQFRRRAILKDFRKKLEDEILFDVPIPYCDPEASPLPVVRDALDHLPPLQAGENTPIFLTTRAGT